MKTVEVRLPDSSWIKTVTAVEERAKSGYDWGGDFLKSGRLVDLAAGSLLVDANTSGSRKHPSKRVRLLVVLPDGTLHLIAKVESLDWSVELRSVAREWLAKDKASSISDALALRVTAHQQANEERCERLARDLEAIKEGFTAIDALSEGERKDVRAVEFFRTVVFNDRNGGIDNRGDVRKGLEEYRTKRVAQHNEAVAESEKIIRESI